MKLFAPVFFLCIACLTAAGCGSAYESTDFPGTWNGLFTEFENDCPFPLNQSLGDLFPMVITEADGIITVSASNGDTAVGGRGEGERISFSAHSTRFGNAGTPIGYSCGTVDYRVSYLGHGDDEAQVSVVVSFINCLRADGAQTIGECSALYLGDATRG